MNVLRFKLKFESPANNTIIMVIQEAEFLACSIVQYAMRRQMAAHTTTVKRRMSSDEDNK